MWSSCGYSVSCHCAHVFHGMSSEKKDKTKLSTNSPFERRQLQTTRYNVMHVVKQMVLLGLGLVESWKINFHACDSILNLQARKNIKDIISLSHSRSRHKA